MKNWRDYFENFLLLLFALQTSGENTGLTTPGWTNSILLLISTTHSPLSLALMVLAMATPSKDWRKIGQGKLASTVITKSVPSIILSG